MPLAAGHPNPAAAVLLAAGSGSRFDGDVPKLRAEVDGQAVLRRAIDAVLESGLPGPYVVTGAVDLKDLLGDAIEVPNERWAEGLASSLRVGITAASRDGHEAVVVALADQPRLSADAWRSVAAASGTPIAVATFGGKRGHPVRLAAGVWDQLPTTGDDGARLLMRDRPELVTEVPCNAGNALDIDTTEDLDRFNSQIRSA